MLKDTHFPQKCLLYIIYTNRLNGIANCGKLLNFYRISLFHFCTMGEIFCVKIDDVCILKIPGLESSIISMPHAHNGMRHNYVIISFRISRTK